VLDFCLVLFFLLLVVAFENAIPWQFIERAVLIHENDVVPVLACLNRCLSIDKIERYSLFSGSTVFVEYSNGRCTV